MLWLEQGQLSHGQPFAAAVPSEWAERTTCRDRWSKPGQSRASQGGHLSQFHLDDLYSVVIHQRGLEMKFVLQEGLTKAVWEIWQGARLNNRKLRTGSGSKPPAQLPSTAKGQGIAQRRHQTSEAQHIHAGQGDRDRQGSGELQRRRMEKILVGHFPKNKCRLKLLLSLGNPLY